MIDECTTSWLNEQNFKKCHEVEDLGIAFFKNEKRVVVIDSQSVAISFYAVADFCLEKEIERIKKIPREERSEIKMMEEIKNQNQLSWPTKKLTPLGVKLFTQQINELNELNSLLKK